MWHRSEQEASYRKDFGPRAEYSNGSMAGVESLLSRLFDPHSVAVNQECANSSPVVNLNLVHSQA